MAISYPARAALAQLPTPLAPLERVSGELGGPRLWVKRDDLTGAALSGNKVRKLEFSIAEALAQRCDTLITCGGLQSNHCRATAIAGARLGLKVHLILRGAPQGAPDGNLFLDDLAGATCSFYAPEEYRTQRPEIFAELAADYAKQGHKAFAIPSGASDEIGAWGYIAASAELKADFDRLGFVPEHIICPLGSGGTLAGLVLGNALYGLNATIWGVNVDDDDAATFKAKIRTDFGKWKERYRQGLDTEGLPINIIDGYVGPGYGRAEAHIFELIARVARTEGLILDPVYTAKTLHGLLSETERGRFSGARNIVFLHTGGIFGLLAQREQFRTLKKA
jgi:D-cysteine desulfhydrase